MAESDVSSTTQRSLLHIVNTPFQTATFGMGCFWGAESLFGGTRGVLRTKVGWAGGTTPATRGDNIEVVSIDFDPTQISYSELLKLFWENHNPEYGGPQAKREYTSLIMYHSEEQKEIALKSIENERLKHEPKVIYTELQEAGAFYPDEDRHQKYQLQTHTEFVRTLGLNSELLQTSHVAARLNGYLSGYGSVEQFLSEADHLGLDSEQKEYVRKFLVENKGASISCH